MTTFVSQTEQQNGKDPSAFVSLGYIFWTFLKLGATAFGGYMSLIAIVQRQLVEIDRKLKEEDLLDGISLVSVLPGPVAVNVIVYIGYKLRGVAGALLAFLGIVLPSFLLVLVLSWGYFRYGNVPVVKSFFVGIAPAVTALILMVGVNMARKNWKTPLQWTVGAVAMGMLVFIGGVWVTFAVIVGSGVAGYVHHLQTAVAQPVTSVAAQPASRQSWLGGLVGVLMAFVVVALFLVPSDACLLLRVASTFSGISLTLFGGGYVVIPTLHELFVTNLGWLSPTAFADGIAIGQVTPGPIFITATFIGYKVAGVTGACISTLAMFVPPAFLTVLLSRFVESVNGSVVVKSAMPCIRAAVIGMIFASVYTIGKTVDIQWGTLLLFGAVALLTYYKWNPIVLILASGIIGMIIF